MVGGLSKETKLLHHDSGTIVNASEISPSQTLVNLCWLISPSKVFLSIESGGRLKASILQS